MRLFRSLAVALAIAFPVAAAAPAHATAYTATYNTGTGFGTQVLSANHGDTITITNNTPLTVAFVASWVDTRTAAPGTSVTLTMTGVDSGTITAAGPGVQNELAIL